MEAEDDLHELLRAANFLTLTECVQTVVARVVADMVPVRLIWRTRSQQQATLTPRGAGNRGPVAAVCRGGHAGRVR